VSKTDRGYYSISSITLLTLFIGVFFLSGASSLIYEVAWTRALNVIFGVTIHAIAAVLASFMAGLALGSYLAGTLADRVKRPLLLYGLIEIGIGLFGVSTLIAIKALMPMYLWLYGAVSDYPAIVPVLRFIVAWCIMLLPASLMGATLPLIVKACSLYLPRIGINVSLLYAFNTAGAAAGTLLAGFVLIGSFGLQGSVYIAASVNVIAGMAAIFLAILSGDRFLNPRQESAPDSMGGPLEYRPSRGLTAALSISFGISGFCALAYEVLWFRVLELFLNGTVYAFSIMLFTFLIGIALGSLLIALVISRNWNWVALFAALQALIGLEVFFSQYAIGKIPRVRDAIVAMPEFSTLFKDSNFVMALVCVLLLLPLTLLLGMTFPIVVQALTGGHSRGSGASVGGLNAANTLGAILGSLVGGLWLLPAMGSQNSLTLLGGVNLAVAGVLFVYSAGMRMRPIWALPVILPGLVLLPALGPQDMLGEVLKNLFKGHEIIWYEEGLENTVSIQRKPDKFLYLYLNSRVEAYDAPDMVNYHGAIGHLPMLLHPDPKDVLVIGLGGGATPGAISSHKDSNIEIVELSPSMVRAAEFFRHVNHDLFRQENVQLRLDDGRNHLLLTDKKYDVITADVLHPNQAGSDNLYSHEYFQLVKEALSDDGIAVQWADSTHIIMYPLIARTFASVFPYVTLWYDGSLIIGSKKQLNLSRDALQARIDATSGREEAKAVGLSSADDLLRNYNGDASALRQRIGDGPIITDDRPLTEYYESLPKPK